MKPHDKTPVDALKETAPPDLPVRLLPGESEGEPESGIGLCLSGGGYRAMLFHLGSLWRQNETGWLPRLDRISSVSGGSIAAAVLGHAWNELQFADGVAARFVDLVVDPIRTLAHETVDIRAGIGGLLLPGTIAEHAAKAYRRHLFRGATLQDLPDPETAPTFILNATSVQSGALWRFSRDYMADWRVGRIDNPDIDLARAVAASAAFPPFLSPLTLDLADATWVTEEGNHLSTGEYRQKAVLTDGGVYDNLGLETVWKRCRSVLVSDAGGAFAFDSDPAGDWPEHLFRVLKLIDNQVRALRKRQAITSYEGGQRDGAYWGIRTDITHYQLADALPAPHQQTLRLAAVPTRLSDLDDLTQERLINWGYAVCDAAMRTYVDRDLPSPDAFPYPDAGVGAKENRNGA